MAVFRFLFFFFTLLVLAACSDDIAIPQVATTPSTQELNQQQLDLYKKTAKPPLTIWGETEKSLKQFKFDCPDCPLSFGKLITNRVDDSAAKPVRYTGNCHGGLIAPDLFLTNRHCIPADLIDSELSCRGRIKVLLPKVSEDTQSHSVDCDKLVNMSEVFPELLEKYPQPDWALVKLDESFDERSTVPHLQGIPDETQAFLFIPLQDPDSLEVTVRKITCTSHQNTLHLPEFSKDEAPLGFFSCDHHVTKGFSGSLLYQETSKGVLAPAATLSHLWDTQINQENILVSKNIIASNLACLPMEGHTLSDDCPFAPGQQEKSRQTLLLGHLDITQKKIRTALEVYLADTSSAIEWDEISMSKVMNDETTPQLKQYWQKLQTLANPRLTDEVLKSYFLTITTLFPKCLKSESIELLKTGEMPKATVPVIDLQMTQGDDGRLQVNFKVTEISTVLGQSRAHPERFAFKEMTPRQPEKRNKMAILSGRFHHSAASIPPCP